MAHSKGCHTTYHHRYHIVWAPKYRYKVLHGEVRLRVREIIRQVCSELGVTIINGVLSSDHVHMFVEIPPHISVSDFVRRQRADHHAKSSRSSSISANATGDSISGDGDSSQPSRATSPMTSS